MEEDRSVDYPFLWIGQAEEVMVQIWEEGIFRQSRFVSLSRDDGSDVPSFHKKIKLGNCDRRVLYIFEVDGVRRFYNTHSVESDFIGGYHVIKPEKLQELRRQQEQSRRLAQSSTSSVTSSSPSGHTAQNALELPTSRSELPIRIEKPSINVAPIHETRRRGKIVQTYVAQKSGQLNVDTLDHVEILEERKDWFRVLRLEGPDGAGGSEGWIPRINVREGPYDSANVAPKQLIPHNGSPSGRYPASTTMSSESLSRVQTKGRYRYRRLDFDTYEIRLLNLSWDYSDPSVLSCSMEHDSLIDPGSYIALSYCWGDPLATENLTVDGFKIDVTVNLASALKAVQKRYLLAGNGIRVWADAVCIDQSNNEERSHQVRSMRQIYSRASQTFCWVGSDQGYDFPEAVEYWLARPMPSEDYLERDCRERCWNTIDRFFSQPYWQRVWVIQEIAVATMANVCYGDFFMPWEDVAQLLAILAEESARPSSSSSRAFQNATHLLDFRNRFLKRHPTGLLDAIRMTHKALATDPRDKIFALLGLCHDAESFVPIPNYKQSLETIIASMSRSMMIAVGSLDLMCVRGTGTHRHTSSSLPTWTPDLINVWAGPLTFQEANFSKWSTAYDLRPILPGSNNQILRVRGRLLGRISRLTALLPPDGGIKNSNPGQSSWISETSTLSQRNDRLRNPTQSELELRDILWQTLTMYRMPTELIRDCFSKLWQAEGRGLVHNLALISWIDQNAWFNVREWTLREWSQITSKFILRNDQQGVFLRVKSSVTWERPTKATSDDLEKFIRRLDSVLSSGMRLAILKGDQPIAMVHPNAEGGDELYLLQGCTIPVVLRAVDDQDGKRQYHVVGGAYTLATDPATPYYEGTKGVEEGWEEIAIA